MVTAMTMNRSGSKVIAAACSRMSGQDWYGMAAVDPDAGSAVPLKAAWVIRNAGPNSALSGLMSRGYGVIGTDCCSGPGDPTALASLRQRD
jgi:hypothetical protein